MEMKLIAGIYAKNVRPNRGGNAEQRGIDEKTHPTIGLKSSTR